MAEGFAKEIDAEVNEDAISRLASFERLADDAKLSVEQKVALAVSGWLVGQGPVPCPAPVETSFQTWDHEPLYYGCPASWLTDSRTTLEMIDPADAGTMRLQAGAAIRGSQAADQPAVDATMPEFGTYLVIAHPGKCVEVTPGCVSYELVGRLEPIELGSETSPIR